MSHAALLLYCVAFVSMFPHEGTGGWIPKPRYESADSVRITAPTSIIATTMSSGSTFGKIWRGLTRPPLAPPVPAAAADPPPRRPDRRPPRGGVVSRPPRGPSRGGRGAGVKR